MRHSFLPEQKQSILKRRYYVRVLVVGLFLVSIAGLIGVGSLFPAYIYGYTEEQSQNMLAVSLKKGQDSTVFNRLQTELQLDAEKIKTLNSGAALVPSEIIERILLSSKQVRITAINVNDITAQGATIVLDGIAPTRESLVAFNARIQAFSSGPKTDVPISTLTKNKDIPFSFKITYTPQ